MPLMCVGGCGCCVRVGGFGFSAIAKAVSVGWCQLFASVVSEGDWRR